MMAVARKRNRCVGEIFKIIMNERFLSKIKYRKLGKEKGDG